jgi:glycosyltransferase involved in cell wall biosynthesis
MGGMSLRVSVIVCTAQSERTSVLLKCLASLRTGTRPPDELFVIVDSNVDLEQSLTSLVHEGVTVLGNHGQPGLSAARNIGLAAAAGDVVAFTDDDAIPDLRWLEHLLRPFEFGDSVLGVGGRVEPAWEVDYPWLPPELHWIWGGTYKGHQTFAGPIRNPYGGNMAFRRDAVARAGGFSADFGKRGDALATADETAFSLQVERLFGPDRIWYTPDALVLHIVPRSRLSRQFFVRRCIAEGRSKAQLRRLFGADALGTERNYARSLLFRSIPGYVSYSVRHRSLDGLRSAGTVLAGLALTGSAFVVKTCEMHIAGN